MTQDHLPNPASGRMAVSHESHSISTGESNLVYDRILVPIDFSEHSNSTVAYALKFASRYHSTIYLLHVFEIPDYVVTPYARRGQSSADARSHVGAAEHEARDTLEVFGQQLSNRGIKVETHFRVGYPFEEIVLMANHFDVDLIIIGSHGRAGIARFLLGSTAERVVEHARCPVLVVKGSRVRATME
jgi:nucleotide-binding universal stress UspA family protein